MTMVSISAFHRAIELVTEEVPTGSCFVLLTVLTHRIYTEETYVGDTALNIVQFIIKLKLINFHVSKDCLVIGGPGILLGICK